MELDTPPDLTAALNDPDKLARAMAVARHDQLALLTQKYRPWRKVRRIARDMEIDPIDAWAYLKLTRFAISHSLPLKAVSGSAFTYCSGPSLLEPLHRIDRAVGGGGTAAMDSAVGVLSDPDNQRRFRIRTLMDEAIESSRIEGAVSTRKDAIELLRSGRDPTTKHEKMFVNNYAAMQEIKRRLEQPLTIDFLQELQQILTRGTLKAPSDGGRLRRASEDVRIVDHRDNSTVFVPPPADLLPERLKRVCDYANQAHTGDKFVHPIVKACILHFMIGYEHPFVDGNGRTARAIFYWAAQRQGYRIFEYLTISDIIREGTSKYPQAYLDSELDGGDVTYFVLYKLGVIEQSLARLANHLAREDERIKESDALIRISKDLNLRQRLLLSHGLRHPQTKYTVKSHANSNGIAENTSRADLQGLLRKKLLVSLRDRKTVVYQLVPGLAAKLAKKPR